MGFWDFLRGPGPSHAVFTPNVTHIGADDLSEMLLGSLTPAQMWATQPHLRTVVSFLARNIAQLGLHTFERDGEDRHRDRTSPFAATMRRPNEDQTAFDLVFATVGDMALYDRAYWLTIEDADGPSGWTFRRVPPPWVTPIPRDAFGIKAYSVLSQNGSTVEVPADQILAFSGYHPSNPRKGSPTVEALKGTLQEQIEASKYRSQVWKRGGRVSAVIERPKDAGSWSETAAERFREDWYAKYTGNGPLAGGTPVLEDGMKLNRIDFSAAEQQFVESAKLSFSTVASAFHVNPTMVGILDNANYSNVREFRRMLYGDTLGPIIAMLEDRVNTFLLPRLGMDNARHYVEFNIAEKLQGSFEEQAAVMSTLVGRPIMTGDEGRAKFNLPALGGDMASVASPLNVLLGGQASPRDTGSQNLNADTSRAVKAASIHLKARAPETYEAKHREVLGKFFDRQGKVVKSRLGAGEDWWDEERWDDELGTDLLKLALLTSEDVALSTLKQAGLKAAAEYDVDRTREFLKVATAKSAAHINQTTRDQVAAALESDEDDAVAHVFDIAADSRTSQIATTAVTFASAFGATEAARQNSDGATKTWVVTSSNPRSSHAAMNGETVPLSENFSNGLPWPGGIGGDVEDVAGCQCELDINFP